MREQISHADFDCYMSRYTGEVKCLFELLNNIIAECFKCVKTSWASKCTLAGIIITNNYCYHNVSDTAHECSCYATYGQ